MTLLVRYESMIDRQLNKAMTQLQKLQSSPMPVQRSSPTVRERDLPPCQGGIKGGSTQNPPAPNEPICDPYNPQSSTISCSPDLPSRSEGTPGAPSFPQERVGDGHHTPNEPNSGGMGKPSLPVADQSSSPSVNEDQLDLRSSPTVREGQLQNDGQDQHDDQTNPNSPEVDLANDTKEKRFIRNINQMCLRMLQDPPALMRFLNNPLLNTSGLEEDDDEDDDDQTNPSVEGSPSSSLQPTASSLLPPVHGPKSKPSNKEET
jgi:hypothetical protein